jgi:hypothetical protein
MVYTLRFFFSSKCSLFHNSNVFGSCIIHILYIYSTNIGTECFKHGVYSPFFPPSKCSLFHNSNLFGSSIIHILYTVCAKIKKNNSCTKRLTTCVCRDSSYKNYRWQQLPTHCVYNLLTLMGTAKSCNRVKKHVTRQYT